MEILQSSYAVWGCTLIFLCYIDFDQPSTVYPKKYQKYQSSPPPIKMKFATPKNIPIPYLDIKKKPKNVRNNSQK